MGLLFSGVVVQLPLLAMLIAGFVLISARRARIGARSALLARIGLAVLAVNLVFQAIWTMLFPRLLSSLDLEYRQFGMLSFGAGLILTVLLAAGIALLIGAIVTRADPATPPWNPGTYAPASPAGSGPGTPTRPSPDPWAPPT
jgi:hypothetical protein